MRIGFDFDGTLAVWPRGARVNYEDASWAMANAAAVLGSVKWLKAVIRCGHDVVIVTGRDALHYGPLRYWLFQFTGRFLQVVTRPNHIRLNEASQATWKAQVLQDLGVDVYIGDNLRIDREAARQAHVRFIDARGFRSGILPPLPMNLISTKGM